MKLFVFSILLLICIVGCESGRNYEEASKYFHDNEVSFNRIEQLFSDNNFDFSIQYYYYPIIDKKFQFEIKVTDTGSVLPSSYYLPPNFTSDDTSFIALKKKLNLNYDALKELSEIMIKMDCYYITFELPNLIVLEEIQFKRDGFYGQNQPRNIKGKWYYYYKPML